jgi:hypothetical protein
MTDAQFLLHIKKRHPEMLAFNPSELHSRNLWQTAHNSHFHSGRPPQDGHYHRKE